MMHDANAEFDFHTQLDLGNSLAGSDAATAIISKCILCPEFGR